MFTAKFFVGGVSGTLLQAYCPDYPCAQVSPTGPARIARPGPALCFA